MKTSKGSKNTITSKNNHFDLLSLENKKIIVFDTETTGLSNYDEIIQISVFELDLKKEDKDNVTEVYSTLIKPIYKKSWPEASKTNHIYPSTVKNAPTMNNIKKKLHHIFTSADVIVGHNVNFDIRMLKNCSGIDLSKKEIVDTLDLFKKDKAIKPHTLEAAVRFYIPNEINWFLNGAHQADTDTKATAKILNEMFQRRKEISILEEINKNKLEEEKEY